MQEIYKVVGYNFGRFNDRSGKEVIFANVFTEQPFKSGSSEDYNFGGVKAAVMKCTDSSLLKNADALLGKDVFLYFNQYGKVSYISPADEAE